MAGIDENTKLYIRFNELPDGATSSADQTGNHTATFIGTAQLSTARTKYAGDSTSLLLDGNGYISIPDSTDWDILGDFTEDWTWECWIKTATKAAIQGVMIQGEGPANKFSIETTGFAKYRYSDGGTRVELIGTTDLSDDAWHHIAIVKKGGVATAEYGLFVDGDQEDYYTTDWTGTLAASLVIGAIETPDQYFTGNIAHVRSQNSNALNAIIESDNSGTCDVPTAEYTSGSGSSAGLTNILKLSRITKSLTAESLMG